MVVFWGFSNYAFSLRWTNKSMGRIWVVKECNPCQHKETNKMVRLKALHVVLNSNQANPLLNYLRFRWYIFNPLLFLYCICSAGGMQKGFCILMLWLLMNIFLSGMKTLELNTSMGTSKFFLVVMVSGQI